MLPNDVHMLVSYLNTKLRDDDMTLEQLLEINDVCLQETTNKLTQAGYQYDTATNQIKRN